MLTSFFRAIILLVVVIIALRIMGKRQIGQLQPSELVVTILLSEIAATPMQDNDIPMVNSFVAIFVLVGIEVLISVACMKNLKLRELMQGHSLIIIRNGIVDQAQIKRLRFTIDDIMEALRQKDVFDLSDVQYAIAETDGTLSILLKPDKRNVSTGDIGKIPPDNGMPCVVVTDGKIIYNNFKDCGMTYKKLNDIIKKTKLSLEDIYLMTVDTKGNYNFIEKDKKV